MKGIELHAAKVDKSPRLQRVDAFLDDGQWHSTMDIITNAKVCAVNSIIAELRQNNRLIDCERRGDAWWYRKQITPQLVLF